MEDVIVVEHLTKRFRLGEQLGQTMLREALVDAIGRAMGAAKSDEKTLWALRDVSFRIGEGELVGIIGRNGAGKSTLLKLLCRIMYPTSGTIRARGRIASLLEVGTGFHDELTGRENVYLNGSIMGMKRAEIDRKLEAVVDFAGVGRFIDTPIKRYSSGMRLRLGFAVAAHMEPDILLVDEVLAVGDIEFQKKCLKSMGDLRGGGRTVLFVSHNMAAVEHLCPRTIWIHGGRVHRDGASSEVIPAYMATFAAVSQGSTDLDAIADRTGSGQARFVGIGFRDRAGQALQYVRSGDPLTVRMCFRTTAHIKDLRVGLEVYSEMGTKVAGSNTWATGFDITSVAPGEGEIDLEIDLLNLTPARYYLSLWLGDSHTLHDRLENCVVLDVEASDYFGSGRAIDHGLGLVFLPGRWTSGRLP